MPLKGREVDIREDCTSHLVNVFVLPDEYGGQEVAILRVEAMPEDGVTLAVGQLVRVDEWFVEDKEPPVILEYVVFIFHAKPGRVLCKFVEAPFRVTTTNRGLLVDFLKTGGIVPIMRGVTIQ